MAFKNRYTGRIIITVNEFTAPSFADAEALMERLVDALAVGTEETDTLPWDAVDWETLVEYEAPDYEDKE